MASIGPQLLRGLLIAAALFAAAPAGATPSMGAPSTPIDEPGRSYLQPIGADAFAATSAGESRVDPAALTARLVGEYQAMPPRQRLAALAALSTAFIVLIGSALLALERRAIAAERPRRAPAAEVAQVAAPPTRALIGDLGRAIRQAAEMEPTADASAVEPPLETGRPRSLDDYFSEIETLRRSRRGVASPTDAKQADIETAAAQPKPGGGFRVSDYPSARRRARARARADQTESAAAETPLETPLASAPVGDAEASKLFVVREIGRQQSEARRLRERGAAAPRPKPPSST